MSRHIAFSELHNFRDVGGYPTQDGRHSVRWGRLYRADSLGLLVGDDLGRFEALQVRTVIDLRHPFEVEHRGRVPEADGLSYHNLPVEVRRWDVTLFDPGLGVGRFLADRYLEVSEDGADLLRSAIETIAVADNAPVVVHCAAGKDRTGLLTALVLSLLGVSREDVVADYALTGLATERFITSWRTRHPEAELWPGFGLAPAEAMDLFLADLDSRHGSVEDYCARTLNLAPQAVELLSNNLLD